MQHSSHETRKSPNKNQLNKKRTITILPFKEPIKVPEDFLEHSWARLRKACEAVHEMEPVEESYERLYKCVEDLCAFKVSDVVYERLRALLREVRLVVFRFHWLFAVVCLFVVIGRLNGWSRGRSRARVSANARVVLARVVFYREREFVKDVFEVTMRMMCCFSFVFCFVIIFSLSLRAFIIIYD